MHLVLSEQQEPDGASGAKGTEHQEVWGIESPGREAPSLLLGASCLQWSEPRDPTVVMGSGVKGWECPAPHIAESVIQPEGRDWWVHRTHSGPGPQGHMVPERQSRQSHSIFDADPV